MLTNTKQTGTLVRILSYSSAILGILLIVFYMLLTKKTFEFELPFSSKTILITLGIFLYNIIAILISFHYRSVPDKTKEMIKKFRYFNFFLYLGYAACVFYLIASFLGRLDEFVNLPMPFTAIGGLYYIIIGYYGIVATKKYDKN